MWRQRCGRAAVVLMLCGGRVEVVLMSRGDCDEVALTSH